MTKKFLSFWSFIDFVRLWSTILLSKEDSSDVYENTPLMIPILKRLRP